MRFAFRGLRLRFVLSMSIILMLFQDSVIFSIPYLPIAGSLLLVSFYLRSIDFSVSAVSSLVLLQYLLWTAYEVSFNLNYDVAFLAPINMILVLIADMCFKSQKTRELWSEVIAVVIWFMIFLFVIQVVVWFIFEHYIDYASYIGSTLSRYYSAKGLILFDARIPRFTGVYDEPSNLAANISLLAITLLSLSSFKKRFRRVCIGAAIVAGLSASWLGYLLSILLLLAVYIGGKANISSYWRRSGILIGFRKIYNGNLSSLTIVALSLCLLLFVFSYIITASRGDFGSNLYDDYRITSAVSILEPFSVAFGIPRSMNPNSLYDDLGFLLSSIKNYGVIFSLPMFYLFLCSALKSLPSILLISLLKIKPFYPLSVFCLSLALNGLVSLGRKRL